MKLTKLEQLKEGMKVRVNLEDGRSVYGEVYKHIDGRMFIHTGKIHASVLPFKNIYVKSIETWKPRTLDELQEGDVVKDNCGIYARILGRCGEVLELSFCEGDIDSGWLYHYGSSVTPIELTKGNYTIADEYYDQEEAKEEETLGDFFRRHRINATGVMVDPEEKSKIGLILSWKNLDTPLSELRIKDE